MWVCVPLTAGFILYISTFYVFKRIFSIQTVSTLSLPPCRKSAERAGAKAGADGEDAQFHSQAT